MSLCLSATGTATAVMETRPKKNTLRSVFIHCMQDGEASHNRDLHSMPGTQHTAMDLPFLSDHEDLNPYDKNRAEL